jgi:hypothetical protein
VISLSGYRPQSRKRDIALSEELFKTNVSGTIRQNKGVPVCLKNDALTKNFTAFRRKGEISIQQCKQGTTEKYDIFVIQFIQQ